MMFYYMRDFGRAERTYQRSDTMLSRMNAKGYRIDKAEDLIPTLEEAFKQKVPAVIDCRVDYDENIKLTEHLKKIYEEL